jgi:hypothetical protein
MSDLFEGDPKWIYESPDRGDTIYRRLPGTTQRDLIQDNRTRDGRPLIEHIREDQLWGEIRRMARTDEGLRELMERVIVHYHLIKDTNRP